MNTLHVELGPRSYPIYIGPGLLARSDLVGAHLAGTQVLVVTNDVVAPLYLEQTLQSLQAFEPQSLVLPDGEQHKNLATFQSIMDALLRLRFNRKCTLVALGGGVIGDLTGFAAACYQRGVHFIQIPTTLLAQVDSSVGGKTGVNHPLGKNMIGAFHQPRCVIADTDTLDTLETRQLAAGMAEVIKYGLIRDAEFFVWLEENMDALNARDAVKLSEAILRSCRNKAEVVAADEREAGQRALLNLGHTFGHAIETATGYGTWLHGEAVAAGMAMAAEFSTELGWLDARDTARVMALLECAQLPVRAPEGVDRQRFMDLMAIDKKVLDGRLRLVLLHAIGRAEVTTDFEQTSLEGYLDRMPRVVTEALGAV